MLDDEAAWLAGLLEGEGCFTFQLGKNRNGGKRKRPSLAVSVSMSDKDVIERVQQVVGAGTISYVPPRKEGWKPLWRWGLSRRAEVIQLVTELRPWMGERRGARIDEMIQFNKDNPVAERFVHGTLSMFQRGCECGECIRGKREYDIKRRVTERKKPPPEHGTNSKYSEGCRCRPCKDAHARYGRDYRALVRKRNEKGDKSGSSI